MAAAERPILYSAPMVRSVLRDTDPKTQTRRVWKLPRGCSWYAEMGGEHEGWFIDEGQPWWLHVNECRCPYGRPGDRLWVRETWAAPHQYDSHQPAHIPALTRWHYAATEDRGGLRWRPSIHMPRAASRITLEITEVRVQRLQEISEADAKAEGIERLDGGHGVRWLNYLHADEGYDAAWEFAKNSFASLFDSINGPGSWDANPWVWAISFTRVQ